MSFDDSKIKNFQNLDELEQEIFTQDEIKDIHKRAERRSQIRRGISDYISQAVIQYMAENKIGFNQFKKQLNMSSATLSRILKGRTNLTLDTIAEISQVTGMDVYIEFKKTS
jgi:transcriptional regulator with XRE-family HTH domain